RPSAMPPFWAAKVTAWLISAGAALRMITEVLSAARAVRPDMHRRQIAPERRRAADLDALEGRIRRPERIGELDERRLRLQPRERHLQQRRTLRFAAPDHRQAGYGGTA